MRPKNEDTEGVPRSYLRIVRSSRRRRHKVYDQGMHSTSKFHVMLERERARSDRNQHPFSVMIFEMVGALNGRFPMDTLAPVLFKRLRTTDEVGRFDALRVGVLLPGTPAKGAAKVARDVYRSIKRADGEQLVCAIYTYPSDDETPPSDHGGKQIPFRDPDRRDETPSTQASGPGSVSSVRSPEDGEMKRVRRAETLLAMRMPVWKRSLDVCVSLTMLVLLSPLCAMMAAYIKLVSPGPIFFRQERIGYQGRRFACWKFRTMHAHADTTPHERYFAGLMQTNEKMAKLDAGDPRIICMGKWIRAAGIDELPQLLNVLRGEMSLIGPRPCIPSEFRNYDPWHKKRCDVLPGLTGLWQVRGKNRTTFLEMMRLDVAYSRRVSLGLDLRIIAETLPSIIVQLGAVPGKETSS